MRGEILGTMASAIGGVIVPRGATAAPQPVWSIVGTTQITEEAANAVYTVSYANALSPGQSATIRVASAAGTAGDGADYAGVATTLTFTGGGATAKTVATTIIEDTIVEGTEDFLVTLSDQSAGSIAASSVNTLVLDEDASLLAWSVSGSTSIDEGDTGTYTVSYTGATLAPGQQATITVATASGALTWPDASAGSDFTALSSVLTFTGGGATAKTVAVSTIEDTDVEGTEDFRVTIGGASVGSFAASQVNTTIADDDVAAFLLDSITGTAVQAYSMRKLRAAYAGNCIRLRRSSDNAESDFGFDGSGNLDTAAIATWLGGANGFVATWYDQSGNGRNATQATATTQPVYIDGGINSMPAVEFAGDDYMTMSAPTATSSCTALVLVQKDNTTDGHALGHASNRQCRINRSGAAEVSLYSGLELVLSYGGTVTDPHLYSWERRGSGAGNSQIWVDGASLGTGDSGTSDISFNVLGARVIGSGMLDGRMGEVLVFQPNVSSSDRVVAEDDIGAYWGVP